MRLLDVWLILLVIRLVDALQRHHVVTSTTLKRSKEATTSAAVESSIAKGERRQHMRSADARQVCSHCHRPPVQCLCDHLPQSKLALETQVLILQHPVEFRRKTISTVPLIPLVLEHAQVHVGRSFEDLAPLLAQVKEQGRLPFLLFPGKDAIVLENASMAKEKLREKASTILDNNVDDDDDNSIDCRSKYLLIVVDGTWTQARRMVRHSPTLLKECQTIQFVGTSNPSIYHNIRQQPEDFCLSTLEACARTLPLLEEGAITDQAVHHLLSALGGLVQVQMELEQHRLEANPATIRDPTKLQQKRDRQRALQQVTTRNRQQRHEEMYNPPSSPPFLLKNENLKLRSLTPEDATFVDTRWPYQSTKSFKMIQKLIEADMSNATRTQTGDHCCLGIEDESKNALVACIMRHRNGSIGMLHVEEDYRKMGLGSILLSQASEALHKRGEPLIAYIVDGNYASEALFSKQGWTKADPLAKKGTGKRKAKRKWVKEL